jgi:hypothetical protein
MRGLNIEITNGNQTASCSIIVAAKITVSVKIYAFCIGYVVVRNN